MICEIQISCRPSLKYFRSMGEAARRSLRRGNNGEMRPVLESVEESRRRGEDPSSPSREFFVDQSRADFIFHIVPRPFLRVEGNMTQ